jgi:hypothetical protein
LVKKVTDKFAELKKAFNPAKIFKALTKYLVIGAIIGVVFVALKILLLNGQQVCSMQLKQSLMNLPQVLANGFKTQFNLSLIKQKNS